MDIDTGYILRFRPNTVDEGDLVETSPIWDNIDEIRMRYDAVPSDLTLGDTRHVHIQKLSDGTAYVVNHTYGRNDTLRVGQPVTVTVENRQESDRTVGSISGWPKIETVELHGGCPAQRVTASVNAVAPYQGLATADARHYTWPSAHDEVPIQATQGESTATHTEHNYYFDLTNRAPISGKATATIEYDERKMRGKITEYDGPWPREGDVLTAEIDHQKAIDVAFFGKSDRIQLTESVPISGSVEVVLTDDVYPLEGKIDKLPEAYPSVGGSYRAYVSRHDDSTYAEPIDFDGFVEIPGGTEGTGFATIEVTDIDDTVEAEVIQYHGTPEVGDLVRAEVTRGSPPVVGKTTAGDFDIRVDEEVLVDGDVIIKITDTEPLLRGVVDSYLDQLPEVGNVVTAEIEPRISFALGYPLFDNYVVFISDPGDYSGLAEVKITKVEDRIQGKIINKTDIDQPRRSTDDPFSDDSNHPNIVRKKY